MTEEETIFKELSDSCKARIVPPDEKIREACRKRWDSLCKPIGGMGSFEELIAQIGAVQGSLHPQLGAAALVIMGADNGVTAEGVSQCGSEVTARVLDNMGAGRSSVCAMSAYQNLHAREASAERERTDVIPVNIGMNTDAQHPAVWNRPVRYGSGNIAKGPAMSGSEAARAVLEGIRIASRLRESGYDLLAAGEMGIGNTTTASACACVLLGADPARMTGKGAGLTEEGLRHKIEVVQGAIRRSGFDRRFSFREEGIRQADTRQADTGQADARQKAVKKSPGSETAPDAIEVLRSVGGFDLLGMCGLYLGGWICQIPVLIDGFVSSVAALAAVRICPACADAILASHRSSEPAAGTVLEALGKKPLITGNLHLGEGTGAVLAMPMLDMALSVYKESVLFGEGGVRQYREL